MDKNKSNANKYTDEQYKKLRKLFRYHQLKKHYELIFPLMLPKIFMTDVLRKMDLNNSYKIRVLLGIAKALLFAMIGYFIFSYFNVDQIQTIVLIHMFLLWIYISTAAYQIYIKTNLHKNDFLMLIIGRYKKKLLIDEINEKMHYSYITSVMPMTIPTAILISVSLDSSIFIPLFILIQIMVFMISRFFIIKLFQLKYIVYRNSYFRDFFKSIFFNISMVIIYGLVLIPIMFIIDESNNPFIYMMGFIYLIGVSLLIYFFFHKWFKKFVKVNFISIIYPKAVSLKNRKAMSYLNYNSPFLKGLDEIEKTIVIKDQKMFKRKNRKEYYGVLFFSTIMIFSAFQFFNEFKVEKDFLSIFVIVLVLSGLAFMVHMFTSVMASSFVSYSSEGSLTQTYQRLSILKKQIFRAKLRIIFLMTIPTILIGLITISLILIDFTLERFIIFAFGVFYFTGISRLKLRNHIYLDIQNENAYLNDYQKRSSGIGTAFILGIIFMTFIPWTIGLLASALLDAFGISFVYIMMSVLIVIILILNILNDVSIRKKFYKKGDH